MKTLSKLILVVLFTLGMSSVATSDVSDILEAHFEAVGGLARLSEIRTGETRCQRATDAI